MATLMVVFTHIQQFFSPEALIQIHTFFAVFPMPLSSIMEAFVRAFFNGRFAVLTFWVLSGFVLSYRYFLLLPDSTADAQRYLLVAAVKRYFRLAVPVLVSVLIALLLINANLMTNKNLAQYYLSIHADWQEYAQWLSAFYSFEPGFFNALKAALWDSFIHYDRATSYNAVLWTMEKEFVGSLFLFSFLALLAWVGNSKWLWVIAIFVLTWLRLHWVTAFLLGALLCSGYCLLLRIRSKPLRTAVSCVLMERRNRNLHSVKEGFEHRPSINGSGEVDLEQALKTHVPPNFIINIEQGLLVLKSPLVSVSCLLGLWMLVGFPNYLGVAHLAIAVVFVVLCLISKPVGQWLSIRPLLFLGKISFGIYLGHFLLIASFSSQLYLLMVDHWTGLIVAASVAIFTLVCSLPLGWLIYRLGDVAGIKLASIVSQFIFSRISKILLNLSRFFLSRRGS